MPIQTARAKCNQCCYECVSFVVAIIARCADYVWTILTSTKKKKKKNNSTSKYFRKLQFLGYHIIIQKRFPAAVKRS